MSLPTLRFGHDETIEMLRDSVRAFAEAEIAPRAASSPKTSPATEMAISESGAIENAV